MASIINSNRLRSWSDPSVDRFQNFTRRPCFGGNITSAIIIAGIEDSFEDICQNYNYVDKTVLEYDHAELICNANFESIKKFHDVKHDNKLSKFITKDIEEKAKTHSMSFNFGRDFVFNHVIQNKLFDNKVEGLEFICEIVLPSSSTYQYRNIDITAISEQTKSCDKDILSTGIRGVKEEIGIDLNKESGLKIINPLYQRDFRRKYSAQLPYYFQIGEKGGATKCNVICAYKEDLLDCQLINDEEYMEEQYRKFEKLTIKSCDI